MCGVAVHEGRERHWPTPYPVLGPLHHGLLKLEMLFDAVRVFSGTARRRLRRRLGFRQARAVGPAGHARSKARLLPCLELVGFARHAKLGDIGDNAFTHVHCLLLWHAMHATSHVGRILRHAQENRLVAGLALARDECMAASALLEGKTIGNPAFGSLHA